MKTFRRLLIISLLALKISSCTLPDPVQPDYIGQVAQLLPEVQQNTAFYQGMDIGRFQLIWMQQLGGVRGVDLEVDKYSLATDNVQRSWYDYYTLIHPKLVTTITYAHEANAPAYRGIGRLLLVLNLQLVSDTWGDIPYEYALGYAQNLLIVPYNTQQKVYGYLIDIIDLAIDDLNIAINDQSPRPQSNDLIYGGNLQKWIRAANLIKLRIKMRIAHRSNDYSEVATIIQDGNLLESNADDLRYAYSGDFQNPYYFNDNVTKNTRVGSFFVDMLSTTEDPRLPVFVSPVSGVPIDFIGTAPGEANEGASFIGLGVASQTNPTFILTYVEQKFIEAEVMHRIGQQPLADQAFEQAVKSSLMRFNVRNAVWESQYAEVNNVTLQQIIEAKYIALFLNPEVWSDYRRTGFPELTPYQGSQVPRRFVYPTQEIAFNGGNVPPGVNIFSRVWWDSL
jgi:hypothetical protein